MDMPHISIMIVRQSLKRSLASLLLSATVFDEMYQIKAKPFEPGLFGRVERKVTPPFNPYEGDDKREVGLYALEGGKRNVQGTVETWHQRLSHVEIYVIRVMAKRQLVDGVKLLDEKEQSQQCTNAWKGTLQVKKKTTASLELVHFDIMGPTRMGANYVITVVKDYSRYRWVFLVKRRSDFSNAFLQWWPIAERQCGTHLKT